MMAIAISRGGNNNRHPRLARTHRLYTSPKSLAMHLVTVSSFSPSFPSSSSFSGWQCGGKRTKLSTVINVCIICCERRSDTRAIDRTKAGNILERALSVGASTHLKNESESAAVDHAKKKRGGNHLSSADSSAAQEETADG